MLSQVLLYYLIDPCTCKKSYLRVPQTDYRVWVHKAKLILREGHALETNYRVRTCKLTYKEVVSHKLITKSGHENMPYRQIMLRKLVTESSMPHEKLPAISMLAI